MHYALVYALVDALALAHRPLQALVHISRRTPTISYYRQVAPRS
eukprot:CAMPEP_0174725492 /NCGR_PEP_ID=MMETSP1094-20130205/45717_1 /TAXON_ID=156173 /ORGANISM="Chrysochromulina brevifilum, Strain UTEX LB 985" /LENGTH=43 /DNA_ID= /DNA_START= /DNA_END= /DNA_ORIENTATION=